MTWDWCTHTVDPSALQLRGVPKVKEIIMRYVLGTGKSGSSLELGYPLGGTVP